MPASGSRLASLARSWVVRSLSVGAVATVADYTLVTVTTQLFDLWAPVATACGLTLGATLAFFGNRRFAFQASHRPLLPQALRFVVGMGSIIAVHAAAVWGLTGPLGVHVLVAKPLADVTILAAGQLLILRRFVFPPELDPVPAGAAAPAPGEVGEAAD